MAGLRRGDDAAFETLVRAYGPRLLALARRYLPVEADAEDVLQSAYLLAFRFIGRFAGTSKLSTWLHRIVVNSALMLLRHRRRHPEVKLDAASPGGQEAVASDAETEPAAGSSCSEALVRKEDHGRLLDALERLPDTDRAAVRLCDVDGLTVSEAALLIDRCATSVKFDLRRGRVALRSMLDPAERSGSPAPSARGRQARLAASGASRR